MDFNFIDIRLFANIAETKSLTHGAERSYLSLPAASLRIKSLEDKLGARLLDRTSHGTMLTPAGQAFLHHGLLMLQQLEDLQSDLKQYAQGVKGKLRISANSTAITEFLPPVLRWYLAAHPGVNVDLRERPSDDIVRAVSHNSVDIGIVAGVCTGDLEVLPYRRDHAAIATAPNHVLARAKNVSFGETLAFDYIGLVESTANYVFLNQHAKNLGKPLKIRIQVGNFETLCRMVESNVGIGLLPESTALRYAKFMSISVVPLSDDWAVLNLQICMRSRRSLPVFAEELVKLLVADSCTAQKVAARSNGSPDTVRSSVSFHRATIRTTP
jgi:DNA-binding transcriptional LysR family regulator